MSFSYALTITLVYKKISATENLRAATNSLFDTQISALQLKLIASTSSFLDNRR